MKSDTSFMNVARLLVHRECVHPVEPASLIVFLPIDLRMRELLTHTSGPEQQLVYR